jgi:plastocyanin
MRQDMEREEPAGAPDEAAAARPGAAALGGWARLSWRRLAQVAAVGDLLVLAVVGSGRQDFEALAVAALLLVGAALARRRRGVLGLVLLGLLFIDGAAFMVPAAASNAAAGEALGGVALPACLAAMSIAGVLAVLAALAWAWRGRHVTGPATARLGRAAAGAASAERGRTAAGPASGGRGPAFLAAGTVVVLAAALAVAGLAGPERRPTVQGSQRISLQASRTAFSTTSLEAHPGPVTVSLANHDLFWHTFTIESLDVNVDVPVGGTRSVTFTAAPGTYTFTCAIPGHAAAGMRGTLVVR